MEVKASLLFKLLPIVPVNSKFLIKKSNVLKVFRLKYVQLFSFLGLW